MLPTKIYSRREIEDALYNNFAYRVGPDDWEKLMPKFFAELDADTEKRPTHEHNFMPDHVPGWRVCTVCRMTIRA